MPELKRLKLKLSDPTYRDDPWTAFKNVREYGTVIPIKIPFMGKCWGVATYEAVSELLKDTDNFVRDPKNAGRKTMVSWQWMIPRVIMSLVHNMLGADHQDHRRLRSLVDKAFAMRNIDSMSERLMLLANEQLDFVAAVADRDGQVDLIEHFARPFPLTVICELLGLPLEDRPKFREWFAPLSKITSVFGIFSMAGGMRKITRYLKERIEIARSQTDEQNDVVKTGLIQQLVQAEHEGCQLSEDELLSMIFLLLVAGHETTVHLISNAVLTLLQNPEAKSELLADWTLSDGAIEEVLRYSSPLQMAKPRFVAQEMEYRGQHLRQGEMIIPLLACANYDPDRFENPEKFDIHRERIYHMTFGSGPHVCLGMKLARAETHFALKGLFERWPNLEPAFDLNYPDWSKRIGTRGMKTLIVNTN